MPAMKYAMLAAVFTIASAAALAQTAAPGSAAAPARPARPAPGPTQTLYMSLADMQAKVGTPNPSGAAVSSSLDRQATWNAQVVSRSADGAVERHDHWIDYTTIVQGEVTMTTGGTQAGNTVDANGESHGGTQTGGTTVVMHAGDYIQIPPGVPHTMTKPKNLIYTIVKVRV
jgi:quercetin dioxygenase-like cupin family protein